MLVLVWLFAVNMLFLLIPAYRFYDSNIGAVGGGTNVYIYGALKYKDNIVLSPTDSKYNPFHYQNSGSDNNGDYLYYFNEGVGIPFTIMLNGVTDTYKWKNLDDGKEYDADYVWCEKWSGSSWIQIHIELVLLASTTYAITYNYTGDLTNSDMIDSDWSGTPAKKYTTGSETSLILPSRAKYKFEGWYTKADCSGTALTSLSATFDTTGYDETIPLYGKWTKTQSVININVAVTGASSSYGNEIILYLISGGKVQSQIVATSGKEIVLTQSVGENYAILVSKPYMWSMTVTGDCTQDTANKNKFSYAVTKTDASITLTFSGGASSSMIAV